MRLSRAVFTALTTAPDTKQSFSKWWIVFPEGFAVLSDITELCGFRLTTVITIQSPSELLSIVAERKVLRPEQ